MRGMTDPTDDVPAARAQLLATEHWGLLASRGSTQAEMLSRISMFLTLISAGLVSIALVGQVSRFDGTFATFSILVLAFIVLVGFLTQIRVAVVGNEDLMYVLAMNRLRASYVAIDPGVAPYFAASPHDDRAGSERTYDFFGTQGDLRHVAGSSVLFLITVEGALVGLLAGTVAHTVLGLLGLSIAIGVVVLLVHFALFTWLGFRAYQAVWKTWQPLNPSPRGT
jgi:hypothetical protein